jgi:lipopolysaccharide transport system permease protein
MGVYGYAPVRNLIFFPIFLAMGLVITLGIGLFLSALTVKYRDLKHAVPFLTQIWFWITPVAYGMENIPKNMEAFFMLNPMTWIIQGFRWSLLGVGEMNLPDLIIVGGLSLVIFISGLFYFRRMEGDFADVI